jgi:hypothetical protein
LRKLRPHRSALGRIRAIVAEMISTEKDLLADRTSGVAYHERNILLIVIFGAGVSIVTRIVVAPAVCGLRRGPRSLM